MLTEHILSFIYLIIELFYVQEVELKYFPAFQNNDKHGNADWNRLSGIWKL
jgi:hypothetical protein